jgi:hypothetical protein
MTPATAVSNSLPDARTTGLTPLGETTVLLFRLHCKMHQLDAAGRAAILTELRETVDEFSAMREGSRD